jgi:hypothetical protein
MATNMMAELRRMRLGMRSKRKEVPKASIHINPEKLRDAVKRDQGLSSVQRNQTLSWLEDPSFLQELRSGAAGGAFALLSSRFLNMKPQTQLLLSIAGFGIGKMIHDHRNNPKNFGQWNSQLKMYEIRN